MKPRTHEDPRRCKARKSNGQPCKARPIAGGTVCRVHGGAAPQVKQAAADRLAALVDPAITALHGLLGASDEKARLGAAKDVLDRNGFKPTEKVDLNVGYSRMSDEELEAEIAKLEARAGGVSRGTGGA